MRGTGALAIFVVGMIAGAALSSRCERSRDQEVIALPTPTPAPTPPPPPYVPNKRIEDHIRLAEVYKRNVDSYYRFIFVGKYDGLPRYYAQVRALIDRYDMLAERFWFTGPVPDEDLRAITLNDEGDPHVFMKTGR